VARGGSEFVTAASRQYCGSRKSGKKGNFGVDLGLPQVGKNKKINN